MPGTLATDWEKERKRERWIVIHRKSIGIPRGLPSLLIYVFISLLTSNPMLIKKTSDCFHFLKKMVFLWKLILIKNAIAVDSRFGIILPPNVFAVPLLA